nr:hypothetical protein [Tanacetum cinerariifolium]
MDTTIDQQVAMDEALIPHARRLRIGSSNFLLLSDISSKESTLQLVYDVLPTVHHHSIWFKMDNKKHIANLESLREMLHICPRVPGQSFVEPPFEEEILSFLRFLGHNGAIRRLTDCLIGKSSGYDSLQLSQAQILWGLYHKRNVDFAYLMWEDFVYHVEHKDTKKSNEMYYPRFTKSGALLPIELTNKDTRNSNAYKEYYAVATGATPPKPKASVRKTRSSSDTTVTPTTAAGPRLSTSAKGKQPATTSKAKSPSALSEVAMTEAQQLKLATKRSLQQTHISQVSGSGADEGTGDDDERDDGDDGEEGNDNDDDDDQEDKGNDKDDQKEDSDDEQASDEEEFIHPSLSTHIEEETKDDESFDHISKTPENTDDEGNNSNLSGPSSCVCTNTTIATITTTLQAPTPPTTTSSTLLQDLPNFGSLFGFDHQLKTLEANFFEFTQTNQFAGAVSSILGIVHRYMDQRMNDTVKVAVQLQSDRLRDEAQKENDEFLKTIDENIQKIIKEKVKEQVKVQISKILPKIEHTVNEQLEAEVLTQSSNSSKTSYPVAANLSEMELKKILIEKIEGNKRCDDDADEDEELSARSDRRSKRRREGKEPDESATTEEPMQATFEMEEPSHPEFETGAEDQPIVEPSQYPEWFSQQKKPPTPDHTPVDFFNFIVNRLKVDTLTPELLAGPTYELMKGSCKSLVELEFFLEEVYKATTDQLDWVNPEESARDVFSKRRIIVVTELKIVEWHNYKHLDWITVRRDDDKLYKFKEGAFKRLRIQDIKDMLLLLVQGKLTNLTVEECFAFNVSLRMFTKSIVIQRHVEDLQLGVKSYQKKINLTKPDTYRSDLKRKEAYIAYSNQRGFIYQDKDKQFRLMRIDELHKFSDGTLTDVRTALDDRLKWIQMKYLPHSI